MKLQLQIEIAPGDWQDATPEMLAGEMWKEHPDEDLKTFMDEWELDQTIAALILLIGGHEVSSRRGGRFRLAIRE